MRILFATMPLDGHFNPLTSIAVHLRQQGHDVRWYAGPSYQQRLHELGIPALVFQQALEVNGENIHTLYPERAGLKGPKLIAFDGNKIFAAQVGNHFNDIRALRAEFEFDAFFCDEAFFAAKLVAEKIGAPVYAVAVGPLLATSRNVPPPFFGLRPARNVFDRITHRVVRAMLDSALRPGLRTYNATLVAEGLQPVTVRDWFDVSHNSARRLFATGVPGLDYPRTDMPANVTYVGPLLPHHRGRPLDGQVQERSNEQVATIAVSQGTVDNDDPSKLIVPALEALKDQPYLVVVTTGGRHTEDLRRRYPHDNVVIEDFVDFEALFTHADLFICNGGFGSVMSALSHGVPVLAAGKSEGKNDINARLDYLGLGIDLKTERPTKDQITDGVTRILEDRRLQQNVARIQANLAAHDPLMIIDKCLAKDGIVAPHPSERRSA